MMVYPVLSRRFRILLRAVELLAWLAALAAVSYVMAASVLLHIYTPPTLKGMLEVFRYGKVTTVVPARHRGATSNDTHKRARKYASEGLLDKAAECYSFLLKLTPDNFEYNLEYGELLLDKGDAGLARKYFERALLLKPSDFYANVDMARTLFRLHRPEDALLRAQKAHSSHLQPQQTRTLVSLYRSIGKYYFSKGRWDDAIALFKRADRSQSNDEIQFMLASCYAVRGFEKAGVMRKAGAWLGLSSPLDDESRNEALRHLNNCLRINPLHEGARLLKAKLK